MKAREIRNALGVAAALLVMPLGVTKAYAHCDSMDGPVVTAARQALATGNVSYTLIWVRPQDEPEIRQAFRQTLQVRDSGAEARELADRWFFETLVRVHRAGEGEPFTGLKPAGSQEGPAIAAADRALERGSLDEVESLLLHAVRDGLRARYQRVAAGKDFGPDQVREGRAWVGAYVPFIHYVDGVYRAAVEGPAEHGAASAESAHRE